ncbi:MAG: oligoendopeptidase F [Clostridia bacterium]|nr:oligoendopeptidase F [Clostridia bacterium]
MERKDIELKYLWNLEDLFTSDDAWKTEYDKVYSEADFSAFQGTLGNKDSFIKFNKLSDSLVIRLEKLFVYAMMKSDGDARSSEYSKLLSMAQQLDVKIEAETAFSVPELLSLDESILKGYIADPDLKPYDYQLKTLLKSKEHVLSKEMEETLASVSEVTSSFREIFTKLDNADLPLAPFTYNGEEYPLTHGLYGQYMQSPDKGLRECAFKAYYKAYKSVLNTITSTYYGNVKKNVFLAKIRKYDSCLSQALSNEDVDESVYHNLLNSVHNSLYLMHDYVKAKKEALKLDEMHMYDMYVPAVEDADIKLKYEDAYKFVIEGLAPLGKDYQSVLQRAFDERWIDVYETTGKRSGAYCCNAFASHPYVLLNYTETTHDVFTIAHEMGHAMHSYFSCKNQPFAKASYKIFVAEVASTVNEVLLHRHILKTATDKKLKKYILSYFLEMIRTTLFRQTQFAEFEYIAHDKVFKGEPLTKDLMDEVYLDLNKRYYGEYVISDEEISHEWARIPHFYSAFYVYKYATGIISALAIADRILTEGEPAVKDYFAFLSSGSSDSPVELLKIAGVDLSKTDAFDKAMNMFKSYLEDFKSI